MTLTNPAHLIILQERTVTGRRRTHMVTGDSSVQVFANSSGSFRPGGAVSIHDRGSCYLTTQELALKF